MPVKCPSCSADVPNVLTQEQHVERLNAKTQENNELKTQLTAAQTAAAGINEIKAERDRLSAEVAKRDRMAERSAAFEEAGVPNTAAIRKGFELVYDSEMSGIEQPTPFKDWLGKEETKAHPLLSVHYVKPQQGQQQANGQQQQQASGQQGSSQSQQQQSSGQQGQQQANGQQQSTRPQGGLTNVDRGASAPPTTDTGPKTAAEVTAYFRSAEYRALPLDKQREEKAKLMSQLQANQRSG